MSHRGNPTGWDDSDDAADRAVRSQGALGMVGTVDEDAPPAIALEEFRRAQASDRWCQAIRKNMNEEGSQYEEDERGVLVRWFGRRKAIDFSL